MHLGELPFAFVDSLSPFLMYSVEELVIVRRRRI